MYPFPATDDSLEKNPTPEIHVKQEDEHSDYQPDLSEKPDHSCIL